MNPTIKDNLSNPPGAGRPRRLGLLISIIFVKKLRTIEARTLLKFKK